MSDDIIIDPLLKQAVMAALAALRADGHAVLEGEDDASLAARLTQAEPEGAGWKLTIASDGLSLSDKEEVERLIHDALPDVAVRINFKRMKPLAGGVNAPGIRGPGGDKQGAAFGLKLARRAIPGVRQVLAIASGKGGVGKSTVSVNLAVALAHKGLRVGLLDADVYGPSAGIMLGVQGPMGVTRDQKLMPHEAYGVKTVSFAFLSDEENPVMWRGPMVSKALTQFCFETDWGELDYLLIDLPPGTGDVQLTLIESIPIHGALVVTTPQKVALLDAHKGLTMFQKLRVPVLGLVENMSHYHCAACGHEESIFGEGAVESFARQKDVRILARIPLVSAIRLGGDAGRPVGADSSSPQGKVFAEFAETLRQNWVM